MILRNSIALRSYQPPWPIQKRRISIGGCAPYCSRCGMLTSSTKTVNFFPAGGPKIPFRRLSILASSRSCVWLADVCAEKPMSTGLYCSGIPFMSLFATCSVFPVPVGPTQSTWQLCVTSRSSTHM